MLSMSIYERFYFQAQVDLAIIIQSAGMVLLCILAVALLLFTFRRMDYFVDLSEQLDVVCLNTNK